MQEVSHFDLSKTNCLVCIDRNESADHRIIGSIDLSLLSVVAHKVDIGDANSEAGYVSNFCIREDHRRNKLGTMLMTSAVHIMPCIHRSVVYAHVNRDNEVSIFFGLTFFDFFWLTFFCFCFCLLARIEIL